MKTRLEEIDDLIAYCDVWYLISNSAYWENELEKYVQLRIEKYLIEQK